MHANGGIGLPGAMPCGTVVLEVSSSKKTLKQRSATLVQVTKN